MLCKKVLKSPVFFLVLLFLLGIALKFYMMSPVLTSSDDVWIPYQIIKYYPYDLSQIFVFDGSSGTVNPMGLLVIGHNLFIFVSNLLFIMAVKSLGFGITEFIWKLPIVLLSTAIVFPAYYLARIFTSRRTAMMSAAFILFLPLSFAFSRSAGSYHASVDLFFQVLVVLMFCKYFSEGRRYALLASLSLAVYLLSGSFFPMMVALIIYMGFVYSFDGSFIEAVKKTAAKLSDFRIWLMPLISFIILLTIFFGTKLALGRYGGDLAHTTSLSGINYFYFAVDFPGYMASLYKNFGMVVFPFTILALVYSLRFLKGFRKETIFLAWFALFAAPFVLFIHYDYYYTYVTYSACAALMLVPIVMEDISKRYKKYAPSCLSLIMESLMFIILALLVVSSIGSAYDIKVPESMTVARVLGTYSGDNGAKTAGYWVRENTSPEAKVYSDANGGGGLEPWIVIYYTLREPITIFDAELEDIRALFLERFNDADVFLITPQNKAWAEQNSPGKIFLNAVIKSDGKDVLYIYSKNDIPLRVMDTEEYNDRFDRKYSKSIVVRSSAFNNY